MARRKQKSETATPEPAAESTTFEAAEAAAHALAGTVTDPAAFAFPIPPASERVEAEGRVADTVASADGKVPTPNAPSRRAEGDGEEKAWKPLFGWRGDHEAGVKLQEDRRFKQVRISFADRPSDDVRRVVRDAGFQWRSQDQAWTRQIDPDKAWRTRAEAEALYDRVTAMIRAERGLEPSRHAEAIPG